MNVLPKSNIVAALSEQHISAITGLSAGQLRAWHRNGFFVPYHAYTNGKSAYSRIYSFRDAVGLKIIAVLKKKHRISLRKLRAVAGKLEERGIEHWADVKLHVVKGDVNFQHPGTDRVESLGDGQYAMLPVIDVMRDVRESIDHLMERSGQKKGKVERHKYTARNSWVIAGTRIPTAAIRRYVEAGFNEAEILREYPTLTQVDIRAALDHEKVLASAG